MMNDDRSLIAMMYGLRAKCKVRYDRAKALGQYELALHYCEVVDSISILIDFLEV